MTTSGERRRDPAFVRDVLTLAGLDVPVEVIAVQTPHDRESAVEWAAKEHLGASDNPVRRRPKPDWIRLFETLDADPEPCQTAVGRWAEHAARIEGGQRRVQVDESITLSLAAGAVMAQQLMLSRMRERAGAALATVWAAWREAESRQGTTPGEAPGLDVIRQVARELTGSEELFEKFARTVPGARPRDEGTAP